MLDPGARCPVQVALWTSADGEVTTLGAGWSRAEARTKARAEAMERRAGFFRGNEARVRASFATLGDRAIHPRQLLLYSARQLREGRGLPRPLPAGDPIDWSPMWSVSRGRWRYVPTALLYYGHPAGRYGRADSNGAAAGATRPSAALHGLLEVIERDSVALWWYNRARRPRLALERGAAPRVERLLRWYEALGRDCWALDLTSDLGIPVVAAVSRRRGRSEEIVLGFGADPDIRRAGERALLEMTQLLAVAESAKRGEVIVPGATRRWLRRARVASERFLVPDTRVRRAGPRTGRRPGAGAAFHGLAARLARLGLEVLVAYLDRPELPLRVARVMVPGLRPWWPRLAPGRLYEAPVAAGWRRRRLTERRVNPQGFFL